MKKIIEGKRYDTETATQIGKYRNGLGCSDFRNYSETLFKTKKGRFFLEGSGGPMTRWAKPSGNMTAGGTGYRPYQRQRPVYGVRKRGLMQIPLKNILRWRTLEKTPVNEGED